MELELNLTHLNGYDTILDDTIYQEETMESIVPDACPDIARIVDTEGSIFLTGKEVKEGRAELSGVVKATVIYLPDGMNGLRHVEVTIPFKCVVDRGDIKPPCRIVASPRIRNTDARSLNPRKVLVRADLCVAVKVLCPGVTSLCSGIQEGEEKGIQQRLANQDVYLVTAVQEKSFTFSDEINISGSRPGAEELLKNRAELHCNESKLIGNKLIFKGEVNLQLLYRAADDSLCSAAFEMPFSQIMEIAGASEDADQTVEIHFRDLSCTLTGGDEGHKISVSMEMTAQGMVRETRRVALLSDIYSTMYSLKAKTDHYIFQKLEASGTERQTVRQQMETEMPVRSVADINVMIGQTNQNREENGVRLSAEAEVTVVYIADDGGSHSVSGRAAADFQVMLPEGSVCTFDCSSYGERLAAPSAGGLEIRFPVDFHYMALSPRRVAAVSDAMLEEDAPRDTSNQPSVILRMVDQESLWDIAKAHATTIGDIMQANGMPDEDASPGRLLLIPKKR